jgi:hypothetical protein
VQARAGGGRHQATAAATAAGAAARAAGAGAACWPTTETAALPPPAHAAPLPAAASATAGSTAVACAAATATTTGSRASQGCASSSSAVARRLGSRCSMRRTTSFAPSETEAHGPPSVAILPWSTAAQTWRSVGPMKGSWPESMRKRTTPADQMSALCFWGREGSGWLGVRGGDVREGWGMSGLSVQRAQHVGGACTPFPRQKAKVKASSPPNTNLVVAAQQHLWRHVVGRPHHLHELLPRLEERRDAEVGRAAARGAALGGEEEVLRLDVAVHHAARVAALQREHDRARRGGGGVLLEPPEAEDVVQQVAAGAELEDEVDGAAVLVGAAQLDDARHADEVLQDLHLGAHVLDVLPAVDALLADGLAGKGLRRDALGDEAGDAKRPAAERDAKLIVGEHLAAAEAREDPGAGAVAGPRRAAGLVLLRVLKLGAGPEAAAPRAAGAAVAVGADEAVARARAEHAAAAGEVEAARAARGADAHAEAAAEAEVHAAGAADKGAAAGAAVGRGRAHSALGHGAAAAVGAARGAAAARWAGRVAYRRAPRPGAAAAVPDAGAAAAAAAAPAAPEVLRERRRVVGARRVGRGGGVPEGAAAAPGLLLMPI